MKAAERASRSLKSRRRELPSSAIAAHVEKPGRQDLTPRLDSVHSRLDSRLDPQLERMALEVLRRDRW